MYVVFHTHPFSIYMDKYIYTWIKDMDIYGQSESALLHDSESIGPPPDQDQKTAHFTVCFFKP